MTARKSRYFYSITALICLMIFTGCGREREEKTQSVSSPKVLTLKYIAGDNGSIEGNINQKVRHGDAGTSVTAIPAEHYHFVGWSDGLKTASRADSNITADLQVTADFAIDQYTLSYTAAENGSIKGAASQKVDYGGTGTEVTAVPAPGYHFAGWSDGLTTASRKDSPIAAEIIVTAIFEINQYTLTYIAGDNGSIEGNINQKVRHGDAGTPVTAVPAAHYHFIGWSDGLKTASRTDSNITSDLQVTADFAIDQYTLSYTAAENGSIKGTASQKVDYGGTGTEVTAVPAPGYHFVGWSDGLKTASRRDSDLKADFAVTANFEINEYSLKYIAGQNGMIEGITSQTVKHGENASSVTAVADRGYHFVKWSDDIETPQRLDANLTGDISVTAIFEENTYTIGGQVSGLVEGTQLVLLNNGKDRLEVAGNGEFRFKTELPHNYTYDVSVSAQPSDPNQICTVANHAGTVSYENVTDIEVTCILVTYTIGGTVAGLPGGDQIVLQNNKSDNIIVRANGYFTFATPLDDNSQYLVTVLSQPAKPNWTCDIINGTGFLRGADIKDIIVDCYPMVVLQAMAGIHKVKLDWNSTDFNDVTFNLCIAKEEIPADGFTGCTDLNGGVLDQNVKNPLTITQLINDISYWFQLEASYASGRQTLSEVVEAIPFGGLNDTGIDWCSDDSQNRSKDGTRGEKSTACATVSSSHPGQDGVLGRDSLARVYKLTKTGSGAAGFDFTKICMSGEAAGEGSCPPNPTLGDGPENWACTRDNVTGLIWEVKSTSGLHNRNNTYSWYNPDENSNGGESGVENGGSCKESDCDTRSFINETNTRELCGANDWRLPTRNELLSIVNNGRQDPAVDPTYFPNTLADYYWSSSPYSEEPDAAWQVYFKYGEAYTNQKNSSDRVRLVRGSTVTFGLDNP